MRPIFFAAGLALVLAVVLSVLWKPVPIESRLLQLQLQDRLPHYALELQQSPPELQALLIDYADDPVLVGKARMALLRYPQMAQEVLALYGPEAVFQAVLKEHGEHVVPPVHYFIHTELQSLALQKRAQALAQAAGEKWRTFWSDESGARSRQSESSTEITPEERGWMAIHSIERGGHHFLGQFVVAADGQVSQVQTERVLEALNTFFAGGIRRLETKLLLDQEIEAIDAAGAALDLFVGVSAVKLLRLGRHSAAGARTMSFSERGSALGASLLRGSAIGLRAARLGAPLALGYIALRHPSVLNSLFLSAAQFLGVSPWVMQSLGWSLVFFPLIVLLYWLLRPLAWLLTGLARLCQWCANLVQGGGRAVAPSGKV